MSEEKTSSPIGEIANKKGCGSAETPNTGKLGCLSLFGTPEHLIALKKGTVISATDTLNLAYITPLVQKGIMIPIIGASAFEDISAEDSYSTNASGEKRLNLKGLPEYKLMFEEGHEFYRELARLESYKSLDFMIGDDEGNWMIATSNVGGTTAYRGFTAGHVTPELTKRKVKGGDAESKSLVVQFLDRLQFDTNYAILHAETLDFTPEDIAQVNGVNLTYEAIPAASDTDVVVKAVLASDNSSLVEALDVPNFKVTVDALGAGTVVEATFTVAMNPAGIYTISLTSPAALAATDIVNVDLWDSTFSVGVTESNSVLYRSDSIEAVVVA